MNACKKNRLIMNNKSYRSKNRLFKWPIANLAATTEIQSNSLKNYWI